MIIYENLVPEEQYDQFSFGLREVHGITLHEAGNTLSALENIEIMVGSHHNYSANIFIDETGVFIAIPINRSTMHTGKAFDKGNINTISIEICRSKSDEKLYSLAKENAIIYIKSLMNKYKLTSRELYFHNDFDGSFYCPHRILTDYGSRKKFIKEEFENYAKNNG